MRFLKSLQAKISAFLSSFDQILTGWLETTLLNLNMSFAEEHNS